MKIGIIGLGSQGQKRLKSHPENIEWTIDPFNKDATFSSFSPSLTNSVEAIFLCVPDSLKRDYILEIVNLGKSILVEKPVILTKEDFQIINKHVTEKSIFFYEAFNHRFYENTIKISQIVNSGTLGEIYSCKYLYANGTARKIHEEKGRESKYGVLSDLGSHLLDLHVFFFGGFKGIISNVRLRKFENTTFDYAAFDLSGDTLFKFEVSYLSWQNRFEIEILGSKGSLRLNGLGKWGNSVLEVHQRPSKPQEPNLIYRREEKEDLTWLAEYQHLSALNLRIFKGNINDTERLNELYELILRSACKS